MDDVEVRFERALVEHRGGVLRICRSILRDEHLGADAAQETFVRLYESLRARRAPERFEAWLRTVAVSVSLDLRRRTESRAAAHERAEALAPPRAPEDPAGAAATQELELRLERALEGLSGAQRTVFVLRHFGDLSLREVAALLGVSLSTAKTHFARAGLQVQRALSAFDPRRGPR